MKEKYFFKTPENLIGCLLADDTFLLRQQNGIKHYQTVNHCPSTVFLPPQGIIDEFFPPRKKYGRARSFVKNIQKHPQCEGLVTIALKGEKGKGLYLNSGSVKKSIDIPYESLKEIWDNIGWYRVTEAAYKALKDLFWNECQEIGPGLQG